MKNKLPNNEMIGYVSNDKHPKTVKVACDKYMWVMRYKKAFRYTKKVWAHDEDSATRLGDIVRVQPLGYRLGPWKTYQIVEVLHREPRGEENLRGSEARMLCLADDAEKKEQINEEQTPGLQQSSPL